MRQGMHKNLIEEAAVARIYHEETRSERADEGEHTEQFVAAFYKAIPGFKTRMATPTEDMGPEIGGRQTVDVVVSFEKEKKNITH